MGEKISRVPTKSTESSNQNNIIPNEHINTTNLNDGRQQQQNGTQIANKMKYTHCVGCLAVKWKPFWSERAGVGEKESANVNPIIAQIKIICINLVSIKKAFCTFLMKCGADVNEQKWHSAYARLQTK